MNAPTLTPPETADALVVRRRYKASPQRVFEAWTRPELLRQWFHATDNHEPCVAETDLRVGGRFRVGMRLRDDANSKPGQGCDHAAGERQFIAGGTYREIQINRKLAFTWQWESGTDAGHEMLITLDFQPSPGGGTELTLTQERFPNEQSRKSHEQGWGGCLDHLGRLVD